jgi:hypothetical protein
MRHRRAAKTRRRMRRPFLLRAEVTVSKAFAMVLLAIAAVAGCGGGGDGPVGQTTSRAATPLPLSWTVSSWFVDPANSTGAANDSNPCVTRTAPCLTYQGIAAKWGTYSPRLRQDTSITFLSSHSDNTDPVYFSPFIEQAATVSIQGVLGPGQQAATGTLSNVVPKNRAAGQLLAATLPAGAAPGQLVVNDTHASRAWVYKSAGGSDWLLSQPMTPSVLPRPGFGVPVEVDTWANGDSVTLYDPVAVNIAEAEPTLVDTAGHENNLIFYQLTALAPPGDVQPELHVASGVNVSFMETSIQRVVNMAPASSDIQPDFINADIANDVRAAVSDPYGFLYFDGGQIRSPAKFASLRSAGFDGDIVLGVATNLDGASYFGVFVDTGVTMVVSAESTFPAFFVVGESQATVWGPGSVEVAGNARLEYRPGPNQAQATFLQTGGFKINGSSTACSFDTTGAGTFRCGLPVTAANLDTPVSGGGFGGNAVNPGGASISNMEGF